MYLIMAQSFGWVITLLWLMWDVCSGVPLGYNDTYSESKTRHGAFGRRPEPTKSHMPRDYDSIHPSTKMYHSSHKNTKKSDMPEKGQIKFMKTLLGQVKTLLHSDDRKKEKFVENKVEPFKIPDKISAVASDNDKLYGMMNNGKDDGKSVNVISIPVDALKTISKSVPSENELRVKGNDDLGHKTKGTKIPLRPVLVQLASNRGENKGLTSFLPVLLSNQGPRLQPLRAYSNSLPDEQNEAPFGTPQVPLIIERHREIAHRSKGDEGLYRDIGHIPDEITNNHDPSEEHSAEDASLRHKSPVRYHHHPREDDDDDFDGDDVDDDTDDDDDDDDDDEDQYDYRNSPQMRTEEQRIAATRKRLYDMLPGNDPTYTSENRGLGLPMMQMPEAFLGNPMVQPGAGNLRNLMPLSIGTALAGEHADNSNDRNVYMFGGQSPKQVYGDSDLDSDNPIRQPSPMRVNSGGFILGGREAQAMSPNEASYQLQKQPGFGELSERGHISRPNKGVLLKVNGRPIGDSRELRSRVVNGELLKGKEKIIKSKGAMDVKVSKATDGVHSKVVDITSTGNVKVLEAKSKIAKSD